MDSKIIMPIIGLGIDIFGYVVKGSGYCGPSFRFVFCDESGSTIPYDVDNYLLLSVNPHYYSATVSPETKSIIIVKSNNTILTIGGYNFTKTHIHDLTSIGNSGMSLTSKSFIKEEKFGENSHLFHPASYLNLMDSPILLNIIQKEIIDNTYYLFSILSFHFLVDLKEEKFENPDDFTYSLIDIDGNQIFSWDKNNQIKCIWYREDGTYTIYSLSECDRECYGYKNQDKYDISNYKKLHILYVNKNYEELTIEDYKNEIVEGLKKNNNFCLCDDEYEEELCDDEIYISSEEYLNWKRRKCFTESTIVVRSDYVNSFCCSLGYNDHYSIKLSYDHLFCDNNYLIAIHNCGFISFNEDKFLCNIDFSHLVAIDMWDSDDYEYVPRITSCKYGNGIVGFQLMKYYTGYYPPDNDCNYDKYIGNYRICDIYGNCIGELNGNLLVSPINGINMPKFYGVINTSDFSIIIPPIFKHIIPLDKYIIEEEISKQKVGSKFSQEILKDENSDEDTYLYRYKKWGCEYGVIEDKTLYIVSQEIGLNGRMLYGIFENAKELVLLGNNDIKKVSGQYLLSKDTSQSLYTLYFHNGKILYNNIKDLEVVNIYNVIIHGKSWEIQHSEISKLVSYSKVYFENGFKILKGDSCLIDEVLQDSNLLLHKHDDVFFKSTLLNGNLILFSLKNGLLLSCYECENIVEIEDVFSTMIKKNRKRNSSYISHIIKYGDEFTSDVEHKINKDLWGHSNHPDVYLNYSADEAMLTKQNGRYRILREFKQHGIIKDSLSTEANMFSDIIEQTNMRLIDPSFIINDVSFLGRDEEFEVNDLVLRIQLANGNIGYYSILKGWIIEPEVVVYFEQYKNYLIYNNHIVTKGGKTYSFDGKLELVTNLGQNSAYYNNSLDSYIIIDSDGHVFKNLERDDEGNFVSNGLQDYYEYQLVLNVKNKELFMKTNPNYRHHEAYCPDPNEWTDEDAWDAMTDGQYGDYPGSGWDSEQFGY